MGGTLEKKVSETFLRVICVAAACGCLCAFCMWRAWNGRPYKGSQQKHQACQLQQTAAFRSDKSQPPTHAPSMPPCMPPSRACSKKHSCQPLNPDPEAWRTEEQGKTKQGQLTQVLNRVLYHVNDWQLLTFLRNNLTVRKKHEKRNRYPSCLYFVCNFTIQHPLSAELSHFQQ